MAVPRQRLSVRPAGLLVDGVPFETFETVKRPSSCPAGSTTAGASSNSPVRLSSAWQANLVQNEHTPGVEASSVHDRDSKYVVVKPVEPVDPIKRPSAEAVDRLWNSPRAEEQASSRLPSVGQAISKLRPSICTCPSVKRSIEPVKRPSSRPRVEGTSSRPPSGERRSCIPRACGGRASRAPVQQPIQSVQRLSRRLRAR